MDFSSQIANVSADVLDQFFNDSPAPLTKDEPKKEGDDKKDENPAPDIFTVEPTDLNPLLEDDDSDEDEEDTTKKDDKKKSSKKEEVKSEEDKDDDSDEDSDDDDSDDTKKEVSSVLKQTVDFLISSGQWKDFEGREELEYDDETFGKLALAQNNEKVTKMFEELIDSTGDYGKAIISHIKSGGNPDEIIDLFKEQKYLENIDTSTPEGKIEKIEKYYSDVIGWKPAKIEKWLRTLAEKGEDEIEAEFSEVEEKYNEYYEEQLEQIQQAQKQQEIARKKEQEVFVTNIKKALTTREDFTDNERKLIEKALFTYKTKLPNGQLVNDFLVEFAKIQQDPESYIDLVLYTMDKKRFKKDTEVKKQESKIVKDTFSFVKGNASVKKSISSVNKKEESKSKTLDFSSLLK